MDRADQRDFDSHYEYWDKIKEPTGGEMKIYAQDVRNAIDSLKALEECLYEGKDYCSVATVVNAMFYLEVFYAGLSGAEFCEEQGIPLDHVSEEELKIEGMEEVDSK